MNRKSLWIVVILSGLFFINSHKLYADEMEVKFKDIARQIANEFSKKASLAAREHPISSEEEERQGKLFYGWQDELRTLIKANPKSIWADDAQYTLATLNAADPKQEASELEYLMKQYPNMHLEDWTREMLTPIVPNPSIPFDQGVRIILCLDYKQLGDTVKLKYMCEESMKKYPDKAKVFEKLLNTPSSVKR